MKKIVCTLFFILITVSFVKAQESEKVEIGKIYFLRSTGFAGSASAFKIFIDGEFVCKLNNKKYSIHEVTAGRHHCSVQFGGKISKESAEKFEVEVTAGKITYVSLVFETGMWVNNIYCEEITENSAKSRMQQMQEDTECK